MLFIMAQGSGKSPMDYCAEAEPMQVHGLTVASYGGGLRCRRVPALEHSGKDLLCRPVVGFAAADDPALGAPVEYIDLRGTTRDRPVRARHCVHRQASPLLAHLTPSSDVKHVC